MAEGALPTGTVTFLFSDMEGSTRLVQDLGPAVFTEVLERHNAVLREAFGRHGATERGTQGDSFLVMFPEAPSAVAAAAEAQVVLSREPWAAGAAVRVRMGLHTGIGRLGGDDYVGLDVHRAARVAALGHGGQVLLSDATRALVEDSLPTRVTLRSLGPYRLRDMDRAEPIHQLVVEGLPSDFPPLHAADQPTGNLPSRLTTFVGRERELAALDALFEEARLVTLTGPGGTGKTRLAIEQARRWAERVPDGAWLVRLETTDDPELVPAAIAATLGLIDMRAGSAEERLATFLADRSMLLVLDNYEQLLPAANQLERYLQAARGLRIMVTSRAPLRLSFEQEFPVSSLGVPPSAADGSADAEAESSDAVRLFVERARRVRPGYVLTPDDAPAVIEICRRLDGLPLGIELAAARMALFPARAIAERLTTRLDLPGSGARDLPARQQTLAATITWSHELLDAPARVLLARLSVFSGGFRLEEAEAVAGTASELGSEVIDALSTLVEHNLVEAVAGADAPRYRMLETIRMFATERLAARGEAEQMRERHALAYLALAEDAARHMPGGDQVPWLDLLSEDHDNLRAALAWAIGAGAAQIAHRLATALWRFWQFRGHVAEGRQRIAEVLAMPGSDEPTVWRAWTHGAAGGLEWWAGNPPGADSFYALELDFGRAVGDRAAIADALFNLCHTRFMDAAEHDRIDRMQAEALRLYRDIGDERGVARVAFISGYPLLALGKVDEAKVHVTSAFAEFERLHDAYYVALAAGALGGIALFTRDYAMAIRHGIRSLRSSAAMGDIASIAIGLRQTAVMLYVLRDLPGAATMFGAFEGQCRRHGYSPPYNMEELLGLVFTLDEIVADLTVDVYREERQRGEALSIDAVIDFVEQAAARHLAAGAATAPGP